MHEQIKPADSPEVPVSEPFINKEEVARRLGKTLRTVDNWMSRGLLPYYKVGRSVVLKWSEVEAHLAHTCRICRS
jgi:excisionase family DNA binding protein